MEQVSVEGLTVHALNQIFFLMLGATDLSLGRSL